jgi:protein CpxP
MDTCMNTRMNARSATGHTAARPGTTRRGPLFATALVLAGAAWALGAGTRVQAAELSSLGMSATSATFATSATSAATQAQRVSQPAPGAAYATKHGDGHGHQQGNSMDVLGGMGLLPSGHHLDRLLDGVKASDAQRAQIQQITAKARADVQALHAGGQGLRDKALALWTAPKLDAAEAEKLRQQMMTHHDRVSKRMQQAMLDVGQVLTPEQRAKAGELIRAQRERMKERMGERADERMKDHGLRGRVAPQDRPAQAGTDR